MDSRPHIFDLDPPALRELMAQWGMPHFRADQVLEWVYRHGVADPQAMTNLSKTDRAALAGRLRFAAATVLSQQQASDGVRKLLLQFDDDGHVDEGDGGDDGDRDGAALPVMGSASRQTECVMIPADDRRTACVSSQFGCPVGCRFCASGLGGLDGNLTAGQIVEQVWRLGAQVHPADAQGAEAQGDAAGRITNVVFMGMGEPLANFEQVTRAVRTLMAQWGPHISARRITISTVGLPAQMRRLAELELPVTLALSLHAPNDEVRRRLIPWAQYVTIAQLIDAGRFYFDRTGREITLEYTLLRGVNDEPAHARQLARLASTLRSNVNLIRYNEVAALPFKRPDDADVRQFQDILRRAGVNTHIRASRGRDIAAACGQLRHEHANA